MKYLSRVHTAAAHSICQSHAKSDNVKSGRIYQSASRRIFIYKKLSWCWQQARRV